MHQSPPIQSTNQDLLSIYSLSNSYFTELSLINAIFLNDAYNILSGEGIKICAMIISQQGDISKIEMEYNGDGKNKKIEEMEQQSREKIYISSRKATKKLSVRLTILQIQTSIKFHLTFKQSHCIHQNENQHNFYPDYEYTDEFWINFRNYLPKKIYQGYKIADLYAQKNKQKFHKLQFIFLERIFKQIIFQISKTCDRENSSKSQSTESLRQQFITAISNNFLKIHSFLSPRYFKNLQLCDRQLYKILHDQNKYKIIYENKWGQTGFDLEEKNWIKLYKNKIMGQWKKNGKKPEYEVLKGFYY